MSNNLEITHFFDQIEISAMELEKIYQLITWQITPSFPYPGRTAWYEFHDPVCLKNDPNRRFYAAKLKGVGLWNPQDFSTYSGVHGSRTSSLPLPPTIEEYEYTSKVRHLGFSNDGQIQIVYSESTPTGGMLHRRAIQEFNNAKTLFEQHVPAIVPFLVAKFSEDMRFKGQDMGVSVSLSEEKEPYRLHPFQFGEDSLSDSERKFYKKIRGSLSVDGDPSDELVRLQMIKKISSQIGHLLHSFSSAGLYRHSGGWDNFQFNTETQTVFLTDLDSSRNINELSQDVKSLQILRDIASSIYKLLNKLYYPSVIEKYTFGNLIKYDPIFELLSSYFPQSRHESIKSVSSKLWIYYAPHFFLFKRHKDQILHNWTSERRKTYKMDEEIFTLLCIGCLYPLYSESDLFDLYPSSFTFQELMQRIKLFLGERFEYLEYLMAI